MFDIENFEIPSSVKIKSNDGRIIVYRVLWIVEFKDEKQIGETDYDTKQIILKKDLDKWTTFWTFYHELEHAISEENGLKVTERQVNGMEVGFARCVNLNGWSTITPKTSQTLKRKKCRKRRKKIS